MNLKTKILTGLGSAALLAPLGVGVAAAAPTAQAAPACSPSVHWSVVKGDRGNVTISITCDGNYQYRAKAKCYTVGSDQGPYTRTGTYRTGGTNSVAGCTVGTWIQSGGYQILNGTSYNVVWYYTGTPLIK